MKWEVLLWRKSGFTTSDRVGLPTGKSYSRVRLLRGLSCSRVSLSPLEEGSLNPRARLPGGVFLRGKAHSTTPILQMRSYKLRSHAAVGVARKGTITAKSHECSPLV
jgi:hypothetical protein